MYNVIKFIYGCGFIETKVKPFPTNFDKAMFMIPFNF